MRATLGDKGKESVVARPGVVGGTLEICDVREKTRGDALVEEGFYAVRLRGDDEEKLAMGKYFEGDADVASVDLSEDGCPVGGGMWPRELHAALGMPLGREEGGADLGLLWACLVGKLEVKGEVADCGGGRGEMDGHGEGRDK